MLDLWLLFDYLLLIILFLILLYFFCAYAGAKLNTFKPFFVLRYYYKLTSCSFFNYIVWLLPPYFYVYFIPFLAINCPTDDISIYSILDTL